MRRWPLGRDVLSSAAIADLVHRARAGDRQAFSELHGHFAPMVHSVLLARVASQEVDDLMQDVFLSAWRGLSKLRQTDHVGAWLATVARNAANRHHRRGWLGRQATAALDDLPDALADPTAEPGHDGAEILAVLRSLPDAYRETLALRLIEGLSGPEISALTGRSHDSVRVNLSRGMQRLRETLSRRGWP